MNKVSMAGVADGVTTLLLGAGVVSSIVLAPNAVQVFGKALDKHLARAQKDKLLRATLKYMKHRRYIEVREQNDGSSMITITEKGRKRYEKRQFDELKIATPKAWDGKWRIVIFDIPETHKSARHALSLKLKELGFVLLQRSVWVHPFPCLAEIELIKSTYGIERYLTLLETNEIDVHNRLVHRFARLLT